MRSQPRQRSACSSVPRRGHHRDDHLRRLHDLLPMMPTAEQEEFLGIPLVLSRRDRPWDRRSQFPPPDKDDEWMLFFLMSRRTCRANTCRAVITPEKRLLAAIFGEPMAFFPQRRRLQRRAQQAVPPGNDEQDEAKSK